MEQPFSGKIKKESFSTLQRKHYYLNVSRGIFKQGSSMAGNPIKVLFVEDNEDHAFLVIHELKKGGYDPLLKRVETLEDVRSSLDSEKWDVILCDYSLPGFNGVDVIEEYRKRDLDYPFIIVSGEIGEDTAVTLMKRGAHDYVFKGNLSPLLPVIEREIREAENRKKRREIEELQRAEAIKFRAMIDSSYDAITLFDDDILIECNATTPQIFKVPNSDTIIGKSIYSLVPDKQADGTLSRDFFSKIITSAKQGMAQDVECIINRFDGSTFDVELTLTILNLPEGPRIQATFRDISERKKAERSMHEQMETIKELQQQEMTMINQNPLPLLLMDLKLKIQKVNASFLEMSGYSEQQLLSMRANDFKVLEKSGSGLRDALTTKKAVTGQLIVEFPTGVHHIEQDIIPLLDKHHEVVSVMSTYKDKTEEIRKEKEIQRMMKEAEEHANLLDIAAQDIGEAFALVSNGDMTTEILKRENDPLLLVKDNANKTIAELRKALQKVSRVSTSVSENMGEISKGSSDIAQATQAVAKNTMQSSEIGKNLIEHMEDITNQISTLSASNEEITSTSQEVLRHARDVATRGGQAQTLGNEANDKMGLVMKIAQESVEDIDELNSQIREINKIVKMINDIAGQINLLALNAAIEAARAGDAGRGFAVVAGEVKNLAADARKATDHIADVITAIQRSSEKTSTAIRSSHSEIAIGVESVNKTIESLNIMVSGASEVTRDMGEIVRAIEDQANIATSIVNTARDGINLTQDNLTQIEELSALAESVSASVQEINSAIVEVEELSGELRTQIQAFKI
ncbi:response regulator [Methanospirillum purgamenti]|uniref:Response regulator n=2 Tax=Methanospirillum TaxID=2202 RepID=A0A8F5VNG0_METHU|nr:methyl-accepting chemotaxis protein [Methanospirillum hungatei]QXO96019.1 response regulator [Methanospirillum hungatei]